MVKKLIAKNYLIIITGLISGLLSFSLLAFINFMIGQILAESYDEISVVNILVFASIVVGFIWSRRILSFQLIKLAQNLFWNLRARVIKMVLKSDYQEFQKRRDEIHSVLVHDVGSLTGASLSIIEFLTSSVVVLACLVYMGFLSFYLFLATLLTALLGVAIYELSARRNDKRFKKSRELEDGFMRYFNAILNGFKEISISPEKGDDIYKRKINPIASEAFGNNTTALISFLNNQITGQVLFYSLIGVFLLIFSVTLDIEPIVTVNFLFILLYLLGAIETIMVLLPPIIQAKVSLSRIRNLEDDLLSITQDNTDSIETVSEPSAFESISVVDLKFAYKDKDGNDSFTVGPLNMKMKKGDIIFVYGGNGSGKTTFIHSLLGLLKSDEGDVFWNEEKVTNLNVGQYKNLFSMVFNDFYLFDEFYANQHFNSEKANEYLKLFEIEEKVTITETGFSTIDLSTGQRKRLGLISALLEEKPIIILDEWAADQDPYFREKFYKEILPFIKEMGITVVAITHDDKYYQNCDTLYSMEFGQLLEVTSSVNS